MTQHRHAGPRGGFATDLLRVGAWPRQKRALIATEPSKVISAAALEVFEPFEDTGRPSGSASADPDPDAAMVGFTGTSLPDRRSLPVPDRA